MNIDINMKLMTIYNLDIKLWNYAMLDFIGAKHAPNPILDCTLQTYFELSPDSNDIQTAIEKMQTIAALVLI